MAYAPFQSSRLASSPSTAFHQAPAPSSSDLPSSPTTASFYNASPSNVASSVSRNTSRPRLYKSQSSNRTSSARNTNFSRDPSSSSPSTSAVTNPFRSIHENARLQRSRQAREAQRDLTQASLIPDEPGGWTQDGEWEEFDQHEKDRLVLEMLKEKKEWKWQMKLKDEQASDALLDPEDEFESDHERDMQEEPPPDILSEYEPPLPSPFDPFSTRLPSLASSVGSSPFLGPSSIAPSPAFDPLELHPDEDEEMSLSNSSPRKGGGSNDSTRSRSIRAFEESLLRATCPACARDGMIGGDETGAKCGNCDWGIKAEILKPLELAFASHGDAERGHLPLFSHTLFTGTIVFCQACDEQFAA
ncbi:hypothetical protein JCM3765_001317 [Sporobolomyces pararoseus]